MYTLGFSKEHDANLLNFFAQSGSQLGNFIYIDNSEEDYDDQMNIAMGECLGLASSSSGKPKMTFLAPS